jgi:hypothetical protein
MLPAWLTALTHTHLHIRPRHLRFVASPARHSCPTLPCRSVCWRNCSCLLATPPLAAACEKPLALQPEHTCLYMLHFCCCLCTNVFEWWQIQANPRRRRRRSSRLRKRRRTKRQELEAASNYESIQLKRLTPWDFAWCRHILCVVSGRSLTSRGSPWSTERLESQRPYWLRHRIGCATRSLPYQ